MNKEVYKRKVELLLRIIPIISEYECFAIHGGTAINLFLKELPRYSVDIDLTYIPLESREESISNINSILCTITNKVKRVVKGINIVHNSKTCKLLCEYKGCQVKIEVNQTKRGIVGGDVIVLPLCEKAQEEFGLYCEARIVPITLLYGGKIAAALSRQHPRDLFDVKHMDVELQKVKEGFMFCLLGSDRPICESFNPNLIDQKEAMEKQDVGMTDISFSYEDFEVVRNKLIIDINDLLTTSDKEFLISFEEGNPMWDKSDYAHFQKYPSVQWKLLNLQKLQKNDSSKMTEYVEKLKEIFC